MRNMKMAIQYDGTEYHGWQVQNRDVTIQGTLIAALTRMLNGYPVKVTGASRTDAGVHAIGQVANFRIPDEIAIRCEAFYNGLNSLLPDDMIITNVQEVQPEFHARFDARGKTYCYQMVNRDSAYMYHQRFAWHLRHPLNIQAMRRAAKYLIGCHDYASFQASSCSAETSTRTIFAIHIVSRKQLIRIFIKANAYLHHMVRNIVGTLVDVGTGKMTPEKIVTILEGKNRTLAGVTAPAHGLFLLKVHY